jgi:uncharacterized protein (TIGR03067 family)
MMPQERNWPWESLTSTWNWVTGAGGGWPTPLIPLRKENAMTKRLFAALLVLAGLAAGSVRADDPQKQMQGVWGATKAKIGQAHATPKQLEMIEIIVEENKLILDEVGKKYEVYFTFNSANPNAIDFYKDSGKKDKIWEGIFEIEGKKLKLCWAPAGQERPKKFGSTKGNEDRDFYFEKKK